MFDGNFRSRREVNLGKNNRTRRKGAGSRQTQRTAGGQPSRQDLLSNAAALRKQRQEQLRQKNAARNIQRSLRGWRSRRYLAQELGARMNSLKNDQTLIVKTNWESIASMRLSRWLKPFLSSLRRELLDCAAIHSSLSSAALPSSSQRDSLWVSRKRIVHATLQVFRPQENGNDLEELQSLFSILKSYFEPSLGQPKIDNSLYLDLVLCTRVWWMKQTTGSSNGTTSWYDDTTRSLFRWSSQSAQGLSSTDQALAWALLSSVIMGISGLFRPEQFHRLQPLLPSEVRSEMAGANYYCYTTLFLPLASSLEHCSAATTDSTTTTMNSSADKATPNLLLQATLDNFKGHETIILSNALDLCQHATNANLDPQPLIRLFHHVLSQRPDLAILSSLVVRGEDLRELMNSSSASEQEDAAALAASILDDDSDDEDEREESSAPRGSATTTPSSPRTSNANKKSRKSAGSRYTRQELLTMHKLDRRYQDEVQSYRKDCLTNLISRNDEHMVELASKIGSAASTWRAWGLALLDHRNAASINQNARESYLALLGLLFQSSTGLRSDHKVTSTSFISLLAFDQDFRERLWFYVRQENATPTSLAVFCDVFCHYLIPLTDGVFLAKHTQGDTRSPSQILAEEVIIRLRDTLYDLYWNKPVLAVDVRLNSSDGGRGRLLLAGTKLWNSLYERWNRMIRDSPFCDESTWWFPHMSSREGDGAVIPSRERRSSDDDEAEPMDIDVDEEDGEDDRQISRTEAEADALADSFSDAKMARVLTCIPQSLPFDRRVKLFQSLLKADKHKTQDEAMQYRRAVAGRMFDSEDATFDFLPAREQVEIHRTNLYSDSMQKLNALGPRLKRKVQVSFINQHGVAEAGIDGGGVFKEFLDDLIKEAFSTDPKKKREAPRLFSVTPLQTLAVNGSLARGNPREMHNLLEHYTYLGRVLGKAVYESILVEPQFCLPFLNQLLNKTNSLEDLKTFDKEMYTNLSKLRGYSDAELEAMDLTFEITIGDNSSPKPKFRNIELLPGGQSKVVNKDNVMQYIFLVAYYRLNVEGHRQTRAFLHGFRDLIPASWVRLFSANELQKLISGDDSVRGIDVASLKRVMQYSAGYHPSQPYIQYFWEILENDLTPQQQKKFLKFMTSCSRQPLLGFGSLEPAPCVQQIRITEDEAGTKNSRLPTSSTCLNLLKLPNYQDKERLRTKLLAAIEAEAGFELT